nr:MAG TPA: hypothetical protein [Caudoviricetes sp.]
MYICLNVSPVNCFTCIIASLCTVGNTNVILLLIISKIIK